MKKRTFTWSNLSPPTLPDLAQRGFVQRNLWTFGSHTSVIKHQQNTAKTTDSFPAKLGRMWGLGPQETELWLQSVGSFTKKFTDMLGQWMLQSVGSFTKTMPISTSPYINYCQSCPYSSEATCLSCFTIFCVFGSPNFAIVAINSSKLMTPLPSVSILGLAFVCSKSPVSDILRYR